MNRMFAVTVLALFALGSALAADRYVSPNGKHTSPFTSWAGASTNLKAAVDLANAANAGETVWVSNGTYLVTTTVLIDKYTIVKGFGANRLDAVVRGNGSTRCFRVNHANAVVEGLTITNGYVFNDGGAAVYLDSGTLRNCFLVKNVGSYAQNWPGGAVRMIQATALVSNCLFVGNCATSGVYSGQTSGSGGGLGMANGLAVDCQFYNNICASAGEGGGAYMTGGRIANCVFARNGSGNGGGVCVNAGTVTDCLFMRNTNSTIYGGGVRLKTANAFLLNSVCVSNQAKTIGAGVAATGGKVFNCTIRDNVVNAGVAGQQGVGAYIESGAVLRNCLITGNRTANAASAGGGVYVYQNGGHLTNCTIVGNAAVSGNGLYLGNNGTVVNCVIYSNQTVNWVCGVTATNGKHFAANCTTPTMAAYGNGNITADPRFISAAGDYRLARGSPCINAGLTRAWMYGAKDLDGRARVEENAVDIGAYESKPGGTLAFIR